MMSALAQLIKKCSLFIQLSLFVASPTVSVIMFVSDYNSDVVVADSNYRAPANFAQDEELVETPSFENEIWLNSVLIDDPTNTITAIRGKFENWERIDQMADNWNLESYAVYNTPDVEWRKSYLKKEMLKYLDKRLAGEIKNAEEGSTMASIGRVNNALKPNANMALSQNVKLRIKILLLQGKGLVNLDNPYVDASAYLNYKGNLNLEVKKDLKEIGFQAAIGVYVNTGRYIASINQKITETISAQVSSTQQVDEMAFSNDGEQVAKLIYSKGF